MKREFTMKRDSNGRFRFNKKPGGGGVCFTINWNRLNDLLKGRDDFFLNHLNDDEYIERFEVGEEGVVVFLEKHKDSPTGAGPAQPHGKL